MNIEQVKKEKRELEKAILQLVNKFSESTGVYVTELNLGHDEISYTGVDGQEIRFQPMARTVRVKVEI